MATPEENLIPRREKRKTLDTMSVEEYQQNLEAIAVKIMVAQVGNKEIMDQAIANVDKNIANGSFSDIYTGIAEDSYSFAKAMMYALYHE